MKEALRGIMKRKWRGGVILYMEDADYSLNVKKKTYLQRLVTCRLIFICI